MTMALEYQVNIETEYMIFKESEWMSAGKQKCL